MWGETALWIEKPPSRSPRGFATSLPVRAAAFGRHLMESSHNRAEYTRRMHRVLEYIDQHLEEPLELSTLSAVAHFSAFHFHRLFSAWMGETLGEYLRRRRLEVAALRLVAQPEVPVLSVALSVGFGSSEAFARAFKGRFGCTATAWRQREAARRSAQLEGFRTARSKQESNPDQAERNPDQENPFGDRHPKTSRRTLREVPMNVKVIDRQPTLVAYQRYVGPVGAPLSEFWQKSVYPWMVTHGLLGQPRFGISHDDPNITSAERFRYDAGVELPPGFTLADGSLTTTLPGGKYAALRFEGTAEEVGDAWTALLREWLPASGMQLDARPFFEYYGPDSTYDPKTEVFSCDLCIPVAPL